MEKSQTVPARHESGMDRRYVIVTPAHNEEAFLPNLISSVAAQTIAPTRWTIVDDRSTDGTARILDEAAARYTWIEAIHIDGERTRLPGGETVLMAFMKPERFKDVGFVLRLDADISFGADFVRLLLSEFDSDPELGIASATLFEPRRDSWYPVAQPAFHTRGPTKMYSLRCLGAIGGLEPCLGWDTVDEIRANMLGFSTRSFGHIRANHHRPQGTARGAWRGFRSKGQAAYYAGYSPLFQILRSGRRMLSSPLGGLMMCAGFFEGYFRRMPMVNDPQLIKFLRRQQRRRLLMLDTVWR